MNSDAYIEFGVVRVESSENHATVDGRCHYGLIMPGATFRTLSEMTVQITAEAWGPTILKPISAVEFKVESIWMYGRQVNVLSAGVTARLELSGIGAKRIVAKLVLT